MNEHSGPIANPISRPNVYQLVAERLMAEIVDGGVAEGEPVPTERELSERYGVGRSSIREGLRMLEAQGVIELSGRGNYVVGSRQSAIARALKTLMTLGQASLHEFHDLRRPIEIEAAGQAALRCTGDDIQQMQRAIDAMKAAGSDRAAALDADLGFHFAMARASHNGALIATITGVREVLRGLIASHAIDTAEAIRQHENILARIAEGDVAGARAATQTHMRWIARSLGGTDKGEEQ